MLRLACFDLLDELTGPSLVYCKHVVGYPHDVGPVTLLQHQHLIHNVLNRTLPVRMTKHFTGAPRAVKRTTTRCYQRYRTFAVARLPRLEIFLHIEDVAVGPR